MRGLSVQTAQEAGLLGADDSAHLALARAASRVLITQDADFLRLAAAGEPHAGIVYFRQGTKVGDMIRHLLLVTEVLSPEEMANHVEFF